jgi:hypothetical protein
MCVVSTVWKNSAAITMSGARVEHLDRAGLYRSCGGMWFVALAPVAQHRPQ